MDEIKDVVKRDSKIRAEIKDEVNEALSQNQKTKDLLIQQKIADCKFQATMLKVAGEQIEDYEEQLEKNQEDLEEKDKIIEDLQNIIGDDSVNQEVLNKHKVSYDHSSDKAKERYRKKAVDKLMLKLNRMLTK